MAAVRLRCFDDFSEDFEEKGWETGPRYGDMPALVAWNGDYCILFDSWSDAGATRAASAGSS